MSNTLPPKSVPSPGSAPRAHGRSRWLSLVALAGVGWLLLNQSDLYTCKFAAVGLSTVFVSLAIRVARAYMNLFQPLARRSELRFRDSTALLWAFPSALLRMLWSCFLGWVLFRHGHLLGSYWTWVPGFVYLCAYAAAGLLVLVALLIPLPLRDGKSSRALDVLMLLLIVPTVIALGRWIWTSQVGLADVRIAAILAVFALLVHMLARDSSENPLTETLLRLRRKVFLGQIDQQSAKQELEIVVLGMRVRHYLHEQIAQFVDAKERFGAALGRGTAMLDAQQSCLKDATLDEAAASAYIVSPRLEEVFREAESASDEMNVVVDSMALKFKIVASAGSKRELREIRDELKQDLQRTTEQLARFREAFRVYSSALLSTANAPKKLGDEQTPPQLAGS